MTFLLGMPKGEIIIGSARHRGECDATDANDNAPASHGPGLPAA